MPDVPAELAEGPKVWHSWLDANTRKATSSSNSLAILGEAGISMA